MNAMRRGAVAETVLPPSANKVSGLSDSMAGRARHAPRPLRNRRRSTVRNRSACFSFIKSLFARGLPSQYSRVSTFLEGGRFDHAHEQSRKAAFLGFEAVDDLIDRLHIIVFQPPT